MAFAIVYVEAPLRRGAIDEDGVGIGHHGTGAPSSPHLLEEDGPRLDIDWNVVVVCRHTQDRPTGLSLSLRVPKVIPRAASRQICRYISGTSLRDGPFSEFLIRLSLFVLVCHGSFLEFRCIHRLINQQQIYQRIH